MNKLKKLILAGVVIVVIFWVFMIITALLNPTTPAADRLDFDTFSLDTLKDEQIVGITSNYKAFMGSRKTSGKKSGVSDFKQEDVDFDESYISSKSITGIVPLSASLVTDGVLRMDIECELNSGKIKLVVLKDGQILEYVDVENTHSVEYSNDGTSVYLVKLLCEEANIKIKITRYIHSKSIE